MDITALYNIAKGFVNKIKHERPTIAADTGWSMCLVVTDDDQIFSAITGIGIYDGRISVCPSECVAPAAMFAAGRSKAKQIIVISMDDYSVSVPYIECLEMLMRLDPDNARCEAAVSEDRAMQVRELLSDDDTTSDNDTPEEAPSDTGSPSPAVDFFSGFGDNDATADGSSPAAAFQGGFDESYYAPQHEPVKTKSDDSASLGAPAEFASSVTVDESNPFYAPPSEAESSAPAVASLSEANEKKASEDFSDNSSKNLSKGDLLKQAKQMKKVAKANFNFFKNKQ